MWHKKHRDHDPDAPPGKRLRENLTDLYSSGEVPGERAQSLLDDAGDFARSMGSDELQDLRGKRTAGSSKKQGPRSSSPTFKKEPLALTVYGRCQMLLHEREGDLAQESCTSLAS